MAAAGCRLRRQVALAQWEGPKVTGCREKRKKQWEGDEVVGSALKLGSKFTFRDTSD